MIPDDLTMPADRDLHESFHALRREIEAAVPPITLPSPTALELRRPRVSSRLVAVTMCLAALIVAALWLLPGSRRHHPPNPGGEQITASITSWKPATDFLLDTPGHALLDTVPSIGDAQPIAIDAHQGNGHRPSKKHTIQ